jgi:uncharacterized protein (UPF0262 family)
MAENTRITAITLDDTTVIRYTPEIEHERQQAISDLLEENSFKPKDTSIGEGGFALHLSMADHKLILDITDEHTGKTTQQRLALKPFRRIVKDYYMICESYFEAIKTGSVQKIESIDMGRRGVHNEGSELLQERLKEHFEFDFDTARRLFTLLCVLHLK